MTPAQMRRLGLTKDEGETGVLHCVFYRSADGPYYLTRAGLADVERRMRREGARDVA